MTRLDLEPRRRLGLGCERQCGASARDALMTLAAVRPLKPQRPPLLSRAQLLRVRCPHEVIPRKPGLELDRFKLCLN